ncbi:MAG: hypothetical protein RLZZ299_12, partial [Pseudomonadota bacterium]
CAELLLDPAARARMSTAARQLGRTDTAEQVADALLARFPAP